jgi:endonuclease VIII
VEGPSLVILEEEVAFLKGKRITAVAGNTKIDKERMLNEVVIDFKSWGKHFLIVFKTFAIRIHFLMFGSYRINEKKDAVPRLQLGFTSDELNFYSCAIVVIEEDLDTVYDWESNVMSENWNATKARKKLKKHPEMNVGDALLDQTIFAGVGNIIKNEVLFRLYIHPLSTVGALPPRTLTKLVDQAREYSFDFYRWKKEFQLKKHWEIYTKRTCPRCQIPTVKDYTGTTQRRSFYCENCQALYN